MERRLTEIASKHNKHIRIGYIPGHFATNHSHVNNYIDMTSIKTKHKMAQATAKELAAKYSAIDINTIICLEGTEVLGAFIASELSGAGINRDANINVITPELNSNNQMIFRDNIQNTVWDKKILLLISSASTGKTINRMEECLQYYSGELVGIAAIFSAIDELNGIKVTSIFSSDDVLDYQTYPSGKCPLCQEGKKVDALVNSFGYSKI